MIPRKLFRKQAERRKKLADSLFAKRGNDWQELGLYKLSQRARKNSVDRFGLEKATKRLELARHLADSRKKDRRHLWGVSFSSGLEKVNQALGINLLQEVRTHAKNGRVLEVGCGAGNTVAELSARNPNIKFSATGIALAPEWRTHKNFRKIDWHVCHAENISKTLPKNSIDFAYSSLGFDKAKQLQKALQQMRLVLKPGGIFAFNASIFWEGEILSYLKKEGFELLRIKECVTPSDDDNPTPISVNRTAYYLKKTMQ